MVTLRKIATTLTCIALLFAMASCSKADPQDIIKAADGYSKSVQELDGEKLIELTKGLDDKASKDLRDRLDLSKLKHDDALVKQAIADTITYKVDESSVKINGKTASCVVTFSVVNIDKRPKKLVDNAEEFVRIIKDLTERDTFTITLTFEKVDGRWLASADNFDKFEDIYYFLDAIFDFVPNT